MEGSFSTVWLEWVRTDTDEGQHRGETTGYEHFELDVADQD
jgi:hypothetical protein